MTLKNIQTPQIETRHRSFRPGRLLWLFTALFLPLFLSLGVWQLNRGFAKEQLLAIQNQDEIAFDAIDWDAPALLRQTRITGTITPSPLLLMDNRTHNGQVGYEVFALVNTSSGDLAVSLGWVKGSQDRTQLPEVTLPFLLRNAQVTLRPPPTNPLFGVEANTQSADDPSVWVNQTLTTDWLTDLEGQPVLGFAQLKDAEEFGVGPVIWQPTTISPDRHFSYAVQWFCMATALFGMFLYAGFIHR